MHWVRLGKIFDKNVFTMVYFGLGLIKRQASGLDLGGSLASSMFGLDDADGSLQRL